MLVLLIAYSFAIFLLPRLSDGTMLRIHFLHALMWCLIHYVGLGLLLHAQSQTKFIVRHFIKNYHYMADGDGGGAVVEAFTNWKAIYNLSMCMTYGGSFKKTFPSASFLTSGTVSCIGVVWKTYVIPYDWIVGNGLLRHILGVVRPIIMTCLDACHIHCTFYASF